MVAVALAVTLVLVQPRLIARAECISASANLRVFVSDERAAADGARISAFGESLQGDWAGGVRVDGQATNNGTNTTAVHLTGHLGGGVSQHSARLNFFATPGTPPAQVDILVYLVGPDRTRAGAGADEALREVAEMEGGDLAESLRGWFGVPTIDFRSADSGSTEC